jgi:hypothetical protein
MSKTFVIRSADRVRDIMRLAYQCATEMASGAAVEVVLRPVKSRRSLEQNAMLWALLSDVSRQVMWVVDGRETKLDPESWKDIFTASLTKEMRVAQGIDGGVVLLGRRTSKMTVAEMADLITLIQAFCAERGVRLPETRFIERWEQAS